MPPASSPLRKSGPQEARVPSHGDAVALDNLLSFQIRMADVALRRHFSAGTAHLDLTRKQVGVLWLIGDHPGIAQADLGRGLAVDRATVMAIVNRLERRGLVTRGQSLTDGRRQTLHLTGKGRDTLAAAQQVALFHEAWLKSRFTEQEVLTLKKLLARLED